ncbi:MAG TPA: exosortase K [Polyangiaceae bacterium]|nr:exosortase K [Polyangiaceae bacterium]
MKTLAGFGTIAPSAFGVRPADALGALAVFGADYGLKSFASHAGARELAPLLAPTAALVTAVSGHVFNAESGAGYVSRELRVVIAPACSGMNFAIVAFTALALGFVTRFRTPRAKALWLCAAAPLAYIATVLVNALRICLALAVGHELAASGVLSAQDAHRALGVCVYLGCLLGLCALAERAFGRRAGNASRNSAARSSWMLLPLGSYVAVTVMTPLLHGAARGAFWTHAAVVGGAAGFVMAVLWLTSHFVGSSERSPGRVVARTAGPAGVRFGLDVPERRGERSLPG